MEQNFGESMNYIKLSFLLSLNMALAILLSSCFGNTESYANHGQQVKSSDFPKPTYQKPLPRNNSYESDGYAEEEHQRNMEDIPQIHSPEGDLNNNRAEENYIDNSIKEPAPPNNGSGYSNKTGTSFSMTSYFDNKLNVSFYYPKGWSVKLRKNILSIVKNKDDPNSQQMHIISMSYKKRVSTKTAVKQLAFYLNKMKAKFSVLQSLKLSSTIRAITFNASPQGAKIQGFAYISVSKYRVIYAMVFGKKNSFTNYNAPLALGYILQSFCSGNQPKTPSIIQTQLALSPSKTAKSHMGISNIWKSLKNLAL
jgi:hypothetical protein